MKAKKLIRNALLLLSGALTLLLIKHLLKSTGREKTVRPLSPESPKEPTRDEVTAFESFLHRIIVKDPDSAISIVQIWEDWALINKSSPDLEIIGGIKREIVFMYFKRVFDTTMQSRRIILDSRRHRSMVGYRIIPTHPEPEDEETCAFGEQNKTPISVFDEFLKDSVLEDPESIVILQEIWNLWAKIHNESRRESTIAGIRRGQVHYRIRKTHEITAATGRGYLRELGNISFHRGYRLRGTPGRKLPISVETTDAGS